METLLSYTWVLGIIIALVIVLVLLKICYKVASIDKALIVTGLFCKKPKIIVSGGAFVIPVLQKADYFDLCMLTVSADADEIKTSTAVPVVADWTAQVRPCVEDLDKLKVAITSFKERGNEGIINDVKLTLTGAVRECVAVMSPEELLRNKEKFKQEVQSSVSDEMDKMGLELVSLNIQDITDNLGYYDNIAAIDIADKDQAAKIKTAEVDRETRQKQAEAKKQAEISEAAAKQETEIAKMEAELAQSEKRKDTDMQLAQFKRDVDTANADAEIAAELQKTVRQKDVEQRKGEVEIMKAEQANLAAQKQREVIITEAESEKKKQEIEAEAQRSVQQIEADASIEVAKRKATAAKEEAEGQAVVEKTKAAARVNVAEQDASAVKMAAEAEAAKVRAQGTAEADVAKAKAEADAAGKEAGFIAEANGTKAKLLAEADGIKAKKLAEAEGERALAEARAANDEVNFKIESLKIKTEAQVQIATATAQIMANIGQNAEFVNIGGGAAKEATGNVLIDTLSQLPALMKMLNAENEALNNRPVTEEVKELSKATLSGLGALKSGDESKENSTGTNKVTGKNADTPADSAK